MEPVRVLVVDDDEAFCEMMMGHLRRKGFHVEGAKDGMEAVQILRSSGPFSVLVTDLMMPGLSGLELLRSAKKVDPLLEVIVITAAESIEMAISALREDGAFDYLTKPLELIGELSLAVERATAHRQLKLESEAIKGSLINGTRRLKEVISQTGIPILVGNEKDEIILFSPKDAPFSSLASKEERGKKKQLMEPFQTLLRRWRSLSGNQVAWVEMKWVNGEEMLAKIAPLPIGDSLGWIIVLQNITLLKRLERFIAGSFAEARARIRESIEKAMVTIAAFEEKFGQGEGDTLDQIGQLKQLFEEAQEGSQDLLTLTSNGSDFQTGNERISLHELLMINQSCYQGERQNGRGGNIQWHLAEDLPMIGLDPTLASELFDHLLKHAKLRTEEDAQIQIKTWMTEGEIWLSVLDNGPDSNEISSGSSINNGLDSRLMSFSQGQMELAQVKLFAEKLGCQVWIQQVEKGGLSVSVCFSDDGDSGEDSVLSDRKISLESDGDGSTSK